MQKSNSYYATSKSNLAYYKKVFDEEFSWIAGPDEKIYPKVSIRPQFIQEAEMPTGMAN